MTKDSDGKLRGFRNALAQLSLGEQKSIFSTLPPEYQAALWQDRLAEGIENLDDPHQERLLLEIVPHLRPESYSDEAENRRLKAFLVDIGQRAGKVFGESPLFDRLTTRLGDHPCPERVVKTAATLPECQCTSRLSGGIAGSGNDCVSLTECKAGGCIRSSFGCGSVWLYACDGLCTGVITGGPTA